MDDVIGFFVVLVVVALVIIYIVVPIIGILIGIGVVIVVGIAGLGFIYGIFVGANNFFDVLKEAHKRLP